MKLHFFSNDSMKYKGKPISAMFKLLKQWQEISYSKCNITIGPSCKEKRISEHILKHTGKNHSVPERHRTILEVNNTKLVYFDAQDHMALGANMDLVPDLFDLCIKFQHAKTGYKNTPFPVTPFTYFSPNNNEDFIKRRSLRKETINNRSFKYSIMWAGQTLKTGNKTRHAIKRHLEKCSKSTVGVSDWESYLDRICNSVIGASTRGIGEFCHRDIEFMAIGTPFFRKTFKTQTCDPLIPNVHYYSIGGDEVGIDKTVNYFVDMFEPDGEIKIFNNDNLGEYQDISNNAMKWYDQNSHPKASLKLLIRILDEYNII